MQPRVVTPRSLIGFCPIHRLALYIEYQAKYRFVSVPATYRNSIVSVLIHEISRTVYRVDIPCQFTYTRRRVLFSDYNVVWESGQDFITKQLLSVFVPVCNQILVSGLELYVTVLHPARTQSSPSPCDCFNRQFKPLHGSPSLE